MEETWKDIQGFPCYQVSDMGRIRSHGKITSSARFRVRRWKDRIIKPKIGKDNCLRVELWRGKDHKTVLVHRLEAVAFLGGSLDSEYTVNHKDGNRLNNNLSNLEWLTRGDNIRHGFATGLYNNVSIQCTLISHDKAMNPVSFRSLTKASEYIGRKPGYISACLKNCKKAVGSDGSVYDVIVGEAKGGLT